MVLLSSAIAFLPRASSQSQDLKILSYNHYIDSAGYLDVVGEVQNVGPNTLTELLITGSAFSPDGVDQGDSYAPVGIENVPVMYLAPQQKAPFYITFYQPNSQQGQSNSWYSIDISKIVLAVGHENTTSNYLYPNLNVKSTSYSIGNIATGTSPDKGVYWVYSTVENNGSLTAENVTVLATFYNSTGNVVGVGSSITPVKSIIPGSSSSFKFGAFDLNQTEVPASYKISSYSLLVQAQGPILQGGAPIITPSPSITASASTNPTGNPTASAPTPSTSGQSSSNPTNLLSPLAIIIIAVIVVLAVVGTIVALRKPKPKLTTKEKIKSRRN
jgi:hypothetical protein